MIGDVLDCCRMHTNTTRTGPLWLLLLSGYLNAVDSHRYDMDWPSVAASAVRISQCCRLPQIQHGLDLCGCFYTNTTWTGPLWLLQLSGYLNAIDSHRYVTDWPSVAASAVGISQCCRLPQIRHGLALCGYFSCWDISMF